MPQLSVWTGVAPVLSTCPLNVKEDLIYIYKTGIYGIDSLPGMLGKARAKKLSRYGHFKLSNVFLRQLSDLNTVRTCKIARLCAPLKIIKNTPRKLGFQIQLNRRMPKGITLLQNYGTEMQMSPVGEYRMVEMEQICKVPTLQWWFSTGFLQTLCTGVS